MTVAVLLQLGGLFVHKYVNLLLRTVGDLSTRFDWKLHPEPLQLLVPMGLSFVTFQSISYVVDVYRGRPTGGTARCTTGSTCSSPARGAGPIVRSSELLAHFDNPHPLTRQSGLEALFRITQGLLKKLLLADVLAAALIDPVYADPASYTAAECVVATVAYTFQIYFDFSGYSDLAVGTAALFGFKLPENFNKPYHARNLFEFWNRWHLSLSTWLRDYLYRPLGGNKGSKAQTLRNLFLVMLLGGLWHGADWKFAVWGGLHGLALVLLRILWWRRGKPEYETLPSKVFGVATTFSVVVFSRVFFRAESVSKGLEVFAQMFTFSWGLQRISVLAAVTLASCIVLYVLPKRVFEVTRSLFERTPVVLRVALLVGLVLLIKSVSSAETQPYIYGSSRAQKAGWARQPKEGRTSVRRCEATPVVLLDLRSAVGSAFDGQLWGPPLDVGVAVVDLPFDPNRSTGVQAHDGAAVDLRTDGDGGGVEHLQRCASVDLVADAHAPRCGDLHVALAVDFLADAHRAADSRELGHALAINLAVDFEILSVGDLLHIGLAVDGSDDHQLLHSANEGHVNRGQQERRSSRLTHSQWACRAHGDSLRGPREGRRPT